MYKDYILSQYANSPRMISLLESFEKSLATDEDITNFYNRIFNIQTATGFGLDFWGVILNISRTLAYNDEVFQLDDDLYRFLLLVRVVANISNSTTPNIQALLRELFKDRGELYVFDTGTMAMSFVLNFYLSEQEKAILTIKGIPPLPTGVSVEVYEIPESDIFGFNGTGYQPFNQAPFRPHIDKWEGYATKQYVVDTHYDLYNEINAKKQNKLIPSGSMQIVDNTISAMTVEVSEENENLTFKQEV